MAKVETKQAKLDQGTLNNTLIVLLFMYIARLTIGSEISALLTMIDFAYCSRTLSERQMSHNKLIEQTDG